MMCARTKSVFYRNCVDIVHPLPASGLGPEECAFLLVPPLHSRLLSSASLSSLVLSSADPHGRWNKSRRIPPGPGNTAAQGRYRPHPGACRESPFWATASVHFWCWSESGIACGSRLGCVASLASNIYCTASWCFRYTKINAGTLY